MSLPYDTTDYRDGLDDGIRPELGAGHVHPQADAGEALDRRAIEV